MPSSSLNEAGTGFSSRVLAGPLSIVLGVVGVALLGFWIPHYLTWPYWADHDVFGNVARAWDRGEQPYLDNRLNNFPGTVYAFYLLGKLVGWGRPWSFYAFDAGLVVTLVILLPVWSRRTFGRFLPGLIGSVVFLRYYESLDYWLAAQRDWQGPGFSVLGLLVVQTWPGRVGRFASACLAAIALSIRPQTIVFLPALGFSVLFGPEPADWRSRFRRGLAWIAVLAVGCVVWILPLVVNGIFDDFVRSIRLVAYGSSYSQVSPSFLALSWLFQPGLARWMLVSIAIIWLASTSEPIVRVRATAWLLALAAATFYKPVSPLPHLYLEIPLAVIGSVNLAILAALLIESPRFASRFKLIGVVVILVLGARSTWPELVGVGPNIRAIEALRSGVESAQTPPGYHKATTKFGDFYPLAAGFYPWSDYRETLLYLRSRTSPSTRVANVLKGVPAIVAEVDRPSVFPAESIAWLLMVRKGDEAAFIRSLEAATDSVVVWSPGEVGPVPEFRVDQLEAAVRRLYQFEARFGVIEVWRRRIESSD